MKRLGLIVVVLLVAVVLYRPATGQDHYEARIASLETRVAGSEADGPSLPTADASPDTPTASLVTLIGTITAYGDSRNLV